MTGRSTRDKWLTKPENFRALLLPLQGKAGAMQKGEKLIAELTHPNIDWKTIVSELRTYLFDYMFELTPHKDAVLPVIFYYLYEATSRKKMSALRACDTFFDRYCFLLSEISEGNGNFTGLKELFDGFSLDFLDLMIRMSKDKYYFGIVIQRVIDLDQLNISGGFHNRELAKKINEFVYLQYKIYTDKIIVTDSKEIAGVTEMLGHGVSIDEIISLFGSVSRDYYSGNVKMIEDFFDRDPEAVFELEKKVLDFTHNSKIWENICAIMRKAVIENQIQGDKNIIAIMAYLIDKSNEGDDRELQLFISRSVVSMCSTFVKNNKPDLLTSVIDLVMPQLFSEIEMERNYLSAFSTIYSLGKLVVESGYTYIIDYFVDLLVKSKFCFPRFSGIASDWSIIVNTSHLENIRTWMKLIEINPSIMRKLAASLIVNLKLGGVFLKDTDVFQRDISRLLNSNYRDVFYKITSLAAVFPAFYHDIGATGNIRAFTEKIDTNHQMNDLIHFIRKQVHVESSSRTVFLIQRIMEYWMTGNKVLLKNLVPSDVYESLDVFFRLINLDTEVVPNKIYQRARRHFEEYSGESFWDFLNSVGEEKFVEFVESNDFNEISDDDKKATLKHIREYYRTCLPTEMTKILQYIRNLYGVDTSKTKIWKLLYEISDDDFRKMFDVVRQCDISRINIEKFIIFLHVYRMLYDKYNFSDIRAIEKLKQYEKENLFEPPADFFEILKGHDILFALDQLLELQHSLKNNILLSHELYDPVDTIEFKRHIAFGIPSMYGSYKEKKFDTLKVFFHMNLIRLRFFEKIIEGYMNFKKPGIDYNEIKRVLDLFIKTFIIDGLSNQEMKDTRNLLDTPDMKLSQFRDVVTSLLTIHGQISDRFNNIFKYVCVEAIKNIGSERLTERFNPGDNMESIDIIVDRFLRDQIMQSPLLQHFDNFLIKLKEFLAWEIEDKGDIICLNRGVRRELSAGQIHVIRKIPGILDERETYMPIWDVGGKGYGLIFAKNMKNINVPEGFIFPPELYPWIKNEGNINNYRFRDKIISRFREYVDGFTNNRYGNPKNPVLFSVRSGAVFSMPGVMDTITNVGLSDDVIGHFAEKDEWFAYDCYRRLIQDFAISLHGMDRSIFENLMRKAKEDAGVALKEKMTGQQMKELTEHYKYVLNDYAFSIPRDPYIQLFYAIMAVYKSWESPLAKNYRKFVNISEDWGTSVIVQQMVFGNMSPLCITGVVQSLYLDQKNIGLFGEYKTRAQGHDIVSGVAKVFPVSEEQKLLHKKHSIYPSLEKNFPDIYVNIFNTVKRIRDEWGNDVEIEFTVENGILYILQIRGAATNIFEVEELEETTDELYKSLLGQGLAASGGAVSGRVVFEIDRIDFLKSIYKDDKIILIRPETNPEDVVGLKKSDGILTCIGGMTSHAVLQMRRLEKSGVSDFSIMKIIEDEKAAVIKSEFAKEDIIIKEGDFITIDGSTGNVYLGFHKTIKKGE